MIKEYKVIVDYVEGRVTASEFHQAFLFDKNLQKTLKLRMNRKYEFLRDYNYNLYDFLANEYGYKSSNWDTIARREGLQEILCAFLDNFGINYNIFTGYKEDFDFLLRIQPDWIGCEDDSIIKPIIDSIPAKLSKTNRIAIGKEKIKNLFRYDKTYPRWIQGAEWPIKDGKPLVFNHQEKVKGTDCYTKFYFYDPITQEQVVIEQFG